MKEVIRKYFIPHKENDYLPHFFREHIVSAFAAFLLFIFALTVVYNGVFLSNYNFLAEVLPPALIGLANDDRLSNSLSELKVNPVLVLAAKYKAEDMAAKGYFAHTSPEGLTPWFWFGKAGYAFSYAGENLAIDFSESADVNTAWMNSAGHRANLLNKNFTEIGVATARGVYQGRETTYVVQLFGKPLPVYAITPAPTLQPTPQVVKTPKKSSPVIIPKAVPKPAPVAQAQVAGEDLQIIAQNTDTNGQYIEVKNSAGNPPTSNTPAPARSLWDRITTFGRKLSGIMTSPNESLAYLYIIIGIFVCMALIAMVTVEIKHQHPRHIIYGLLLLLLIGGLVYLNFYVLYSHVVVI